MRSFVTYTIIVAVAIILVINPVVVFLLTHNRGLSVFVALLDFWLLAAVVSGALFLKSRRAAYGWATLGFVVTLLPVMLVGEGTFTYLRNHYGARLLGQVAEIYQPDPLLVYKLAPNVSSRHSKAGDFDVVYVTDDKGRKQIDQDPGARHTLHVFGDSFAFGYGVANADTWLNLLSAQLGPDINVLNYGVVGYGLEQMALSLEHNIGEIKTGDTVIFAPVAADLDRSLAGKTYVCGGLIRPEANRTFPKLEGDRWVTVELRDACNFLLDTVLANSPFPIGFGALYRSYREATLYPDMVASADRIFAAAKRLVAQRDARFAVVFLPTPNECAAGGFSVSLDGLATPHLSLMPYCPKDAAAAMDLKFTYDGHWNPSGHAWAASALDDVLKQLPSNDAAREASR